ncbi:DUF2808 domain-containing protein [Myxosarcina sp. GI1]|uniref:DUF2808 domain-containing protein n=1 Tax=Myxosarcina sp. GI1 TaxID=1541065 RepID=UPI0006923486|nr:DUF2808 domain-containing protein [Myxosarcina sp. GI1]
MVSKLSFKTCLTSLAVATCTLGGLGAIANAQGGSGLVIFGKEDVDVLNYYLDFGGKADARDRYRLRIPGKKLIGGASKFFISYPDYFDGKFDTDRIEVRVQKDGEEESLPLREVIWDQESQIIEIDLEEPLKESRKVEIVFSNVRNPEVGTYYFFAQVLPATDLPIREQLGAWVISIDP